MKIVTEIRYLFRDMEIIINIFHVNILELFFFFLSEFLIEEFLNHLVVGFLAWILTKFVKLPIR